MNNRNVNVILGVIIALLLAVICYLLIDRSKGVEVAQAPAMTDSRPAEQAIAPTQTITQAATPAAEEKWRTYVNLEYGYSVSLPESYDLPDPRAKQAWFVSSEGRIEISIKDNQYIHNGTKNVPIELKDYRYLDFDQAGQAKLGGEPAVFFEAPRGYCDGPGCSDPFIAYSAHQSVATYYNVIFYGDAKLNATEEKILKSFKFREPV